MALHSSVRLRLARLFIASLLGTSAVIASRDACAVDREACFSAAESAQQLRGQSKLRDARDKLVVCAQEGCPGSVRKDCAKWLAEVKEAVPSIVVTARDAHGNDVSDVSVTVDGQKVATSLDGRPLEIDPGDHRVHLEREGSKPVDKSVVVAAGQRLRAVQVELEDVASAPPPPPPLPPPPSESASRPVPVVSIVLGAVGVAALGSTTYFWVSGRSDYSGLKTSCSPGCDPSTVDPIRTKLLIGDVSLGVAVASLGLATWFFVTRPQRESTGMTTQVGVEPRLGGGMASVRGSF